MAEKLEFDEFYDQMYRKINNEKNSQLNDKLKTMNEKVKRNKKIKLISLIIINIITIICSKNIIQRVIDIGEYELLMLAAILYFVYNIIALDIIKLIIGEYSMNSEYKILYKENLVKEIIKNFFDDVEYFPNKVIPEQIYKEAEYSTRYDKYAGDDYIEAKLDDKYLISMSELYLTHTETYTSTGPHGNIHTETKTVVDYSGIFFKLTSDKSINTNLRITLNKSWHSKKRQEMDSSEFERYFDVESDDKIKAMQLLTSEIMNELVEFREKMNINYDIVIKNNDIYIRFFCGKSFEPNSIQNGILDIEPITKYYNILKFTYEISKKIIDNINIIEL